MGAESACENSSLLQRPSVVGSLISPVSLERWRDLPIAEGCDIVEFRLDAYPASVPVVSEIIDVLSVPALVAARDPREGGLHSLGFSPRRALLLALLEQVQLVDIELANAGLLSDVIERAREGGVCVIASSHDFTGVPSNGEIDDLIGQALDCGADALKIAATPHTPGDLARLADRLAAPPLPLSLMGMGALGRVSRLLLGQLGSCLNYGYLDEGSVSGQWPAGDLKRLLETIRQETKPAASPAAEGADETRAAEPPPENPHVSAN